MGVMNIIGNWKQVAPFNFQENDHDYGLFEKDQDVDDKAGEDNKNQDKDNGPDFDHTANKMLPKNVTSN